MSQVEVSKTEYQISFYQEIQNKKKVLKDYLNFSKNFL